MDRVTAPPQGRILVSRTRKARRAGFCVLCPAPVITGQRVGKLPQGWAHVSCAAALIMAANPDPAEAS